MRWLNGTILAGVLLFATAPIASADEPTLANTAPVVVGTAPIAGQTDVAPGTTEIRVTFSRPMRDGSWSWVKLSEASFPKMTGTPRFLDDQRSCVLPVSLEPGKTYAMWLNQPPYENFQDPDGRKAVPYLLVFQTRQ
jgi:RNA polymerase sigma-70 factor (ECF subfamily)